MRNMSKKTWKLRVCPHMTEMQKLDILLKKDKIPHTYGRRWPEMDRPDTPDYLPGGRHDGGEQIVVFDAAGNRIWDGVWGWGSYGFEQGLIEVMGAQLLGHDDVEGWLTAHQVIKMWRCRKYAAKIAEFIKKIFSIEPIPTTVNTLREALRDLEVARNHFENCDPEFVTAAIFELNAAECRVDAARRCAG